MPLSEDLAAIEAYIAVCIDGPRQIDRDGLVELRIVMGGFAERAETLERALDVLADHVSPPRDRAAVEAAVASGKVVVLAAHRLAQAPELEMPGWLA